MQPSNLFSEIKEMMIQSSNCKSQHDGNIHNQQSLTMESTNR